MMKKIIIILLSFYSTFAQEKMNTTTTDLSKITFNEDISQLVQSKRGYKKMVTKGVFDTKSEEEIGKKEKIAALIYDFKKEKKSVQFSTFFYFDNLKILATPENEIIAFDTFSFYEGPLKSIDNFVAKLTEMYKGKKPLTGKIAGGILAYQWDLPETVVQFVRDAEQESESEFINGKEVVKKTCYVRFTIYKKKYLKGEISDYLEQTKDFTLFNNKHFQ